MFPLNKIQKWLIGDFFLKKYYYLIKMIKIVKKENILENRCLPS